jgi:hypothetical protein
MWLRDLDRLVEKPPRETTQRHPGGSEANPDTVVRRYLMLFEKWI